MASFLNLASQREGSLVKLVTMYRAKNGERKGDLVHVENKMAHLALRRKGALEGRLSRPW